MYMRFLVLDKNYFRKETYTQTKNLVVISFNR